MVSDFELFGTNTGFISGPIASLNMGFFIDAPVLNSGGWTLTQDANTYSGMFTPATESILQASPTTRACLPSGSSFTASK